MKLKVTKALVIVVAVLLSFGAIFVTLSALQLSSASDTVSSMGEASEDMGSNIDAKEKDDTQVNSILTVFNSSPQIRADILISAKRNDGTQIESERFEEIRTELATQFGGVTVLPRFNGTSIHDGVRNDGTNNSGFFVVVDNSAENIGWLIHYKSVLQDRLNQDRIFMTFSPTAISP